MRQKKTSSEVGPRFPSLHKRKNQALVLVGSVGIAIVVLIAAILGTTPGPAILEPGLPPNFDFEGNVTIVGPLVFVPVWNECTQDYRPMYEGYDCDQLRDAFGLLPPVPADLADMAKLYFDNKISIQRISPDYWRQPEFYAGWNLATLNIQQQPAFPIWTPFGYSFYFSAQGVTVGRASPGTEQGFVEMRTLFRAGWGTDTWQGLHVYPAYPENAFKQDGKPLLNSEGNPITQDPATVPFTVSITNPSDQLYNQWLEEGRFEDDRKESGQFFILPPSHPSFTNEWVQLLTLRIEFTVPASELPSGMWFFTLYTSNPSSEVSEEYYYKYGNYYVPAGERVVGSLTPLFQGFVVIR